MAVADLTRAAGAADTGGDGRLLAVSDLHVSFQTPHGVVDAVRGVSFSIGRGETVGILGESGSGKSVSVGAVMGLLDSPPARIGGEIRYGGVDLLRAPVRETRRVHGDRVAMVNQDAVTALNPGLTVGYQIGEMFRVHRPGTSRADARRRAVELMDRVKIPSARQRVQSYPHEFSGGMSQRVMIAMAIALEPDILIADEPTTALDVTVQAQIMQLLAELREQTGMALILITHDLGVVARRCPRSTPPNAPAASSSRAKCRAPSTRPRAAVSAPAASRPRPAARPRSRPSPRAPAATRAPATSPPPPGAEPRSLSIGRQGVGDVGEGARLRHGCGLPSRSRRCAHAISSTGSRLLSSRPVAGRVSEYRPISGAESSPGERRSMISLAVQERRRRG